MMKVKKGKKRFWMITRNVRLVLGFLIFIEMDLSLIIVMH